MDGKDGYYRRSQPSRPFTSTYNGDYDYICATCFNSREVTEPMWTLAPPPAKCTCDLRFGCTCPVGRAELAAERAKRRERDKNRLHYI